MAPEDSKHRKTAVHLGRSLLEALVCPSKGHLRMQEGQRIIGDSHPHVVILFSDIVGFSTLAMDLPAIEVFMLVSCPCP